MNKQLSEFTDLELVRAQQQVYTQLMQAQGNLQAINSEVERREKLVTVSPEAKKVADKIMNEKPK